MFIYNVLESLKITVTKRLLTVRLHAFCLVGVSAVRQAGCPKGGAYASLSYNSIVLQIFHVFVGILRLRHSFFHILQPLPSTLLTKYRPQTSFAASLRTPWLCIWFLFILFCLRISLHPTFHDAVALGYLIQLYQQLIEDFCPSYAP